MPSESERPVEPAATEPASSAPKLPPFKRGAPASMVLPALTKPLVVAPDAASKVLTTLLFNDVSDQAAMCDPNDPDCELL